MEQENRVVVLIDMDCFYCQVEEKLNPDLKGKPIAVVQYNPWKGGGIIAVNYVARAMGVTRYMRGDEAKEKCPEIQLPSVPCVRGKADTTKYRDAGKEVARVLQRFTPLLERASVDEAYLDITKHVEERLKILNVNMVDTKLLPNTYALGYEDLNEFITDVHNCGSESIEFDYEHARRLLVGAVVVSDIRTAVYDETGYRCSAGIANNKTLAKLVCGMNKPNKQTILPKHSVNILYRTLSLKKVKHLGGKFGDTVCELLKINTMAEMQRFTEKELQAKFDEKNGTWLYNIARGIDLEPVQARFNPKSIGCCKQLRGKSALTSLDSLKKWLKDLGDEIEERLEKDALENNRNPRQMVVSYSAQLNDGRNSSSSRSYNFVADDELSGDLFASKALELVMDSLEGVKLQDGETSRTLRTPITFLGISVGKFEDNSETKKIKRIVDYFGAGSSKDSIIKTKINTNEDEAKKLPADNKHGKEFILQKFFRTSSKDNESKNNTKCVTKVDEEHTTLTNSKVIETALDKQESFFAKFLNRELKGKLNTKEKDTSLDRAETTHPTTPTCEILNCGENSNDTDYSGSTINNEINKSIALFDEDPTDIDRVSSMRKLLTTSAADDVDTEQLQECENKVNVETAQTLQISPASRPSESFKCSDCGKTLVIDMFEMHADYHLALKLRDEERQQFRNEIKEKNLKLASNKSIKQKSSVEEQCNKMETVSTSIANFLVKIDDSVPTEMCSECGMRVSVNKFAEHLDFHEAQKLSRELNKKSTPGYFTSNSVKRKRKSPSSPVKKTTKVPCKSIHSFFKQHLD